MLSHGNEPLSTKSTTSLAALRRQWINTARSFRNKYMQLGEGFVGRYPFSCFLLSCYVVFSLCLTATHLTAWYLQPSAQSTASVLVPHRTYDAAQDYSMIDTLSHGLRMSKLLPLSHYETTRNTEPYWLKGQAPNTDLTLTTGLKISDWPAFRRLAERWSGPISATLMVSKEERSISGELASIVEEHRKRPDLFGQVDIHLLEVPEKAAGIAAMLIPRNGERNVARLYARTGYVCDMPIGVLPSPHLQTTWKANHTGYQALLDDGHMLVLPMFTSPALPATKLEILEEISKNKITPVDPIDLRQWQTTDSIYLVKHYDPSYSPIAIQSKTAVPWCPERFMDQRSACFFDIYLAGGEFYGMGSEYALTVSEPETIGHVNHVIETRMYAKYFWEQCVHHARQLDALGLWKSPRSSHVRGQCSRVILNWGRGLIGKPH
ncbi:glycosyltransferase family 49 protein [Phycomyces blakesleeanus]